MKYKLWNRKDTINGVAADHFLKQPVFKSYDGDIILIYGDSGKVSQVERKDTLAKLYNIDVNLGLDGFMSVYFDKLAELEAQAQENLEG